MIPARGPSRALPLGIGIAAASIWIAWSMQNCYWVGRSAGTARRYESQGIALCRAELALRAVAVRRHAARTGRLPDTLDDCAADLVNIEDWLAWATDHWTARHEWPFHLLLQRSSYAIDEPWHPAVPYPPPTAPKPSAAQDLFGLPIVYRQGVKPADDPSWIDSTDPLPPEVQEFLATVGEPPPPPPQPFALSSLFVRERLQYLATLDREAAVARTLLISGTVGILAFTALLTVLWRGPRTGKPGVIGVLVSVIVGTVTVHFSYMSTMVTCYAIASFSSNRVSRQDRLDLLDAAVHRGEVSEEAATRARAYIEKLPQ